MNTCATCRFFHFSHAEAGQCRRHAPSLPIPSYGRWPKVGPEEWCGDFEIRPELRSCKTCDKAVGATPFSAPHLQHATLYPICKECYEQFTAGTHPFQIKV